MSQSSPAPAPAFLPHTAVAELVSLLQGEGYTVVAPTVADGVISFRPIASAEQMARAVKDQQGPGNYRVRPGDADLSFEYAVGADGPKRYLFPPAQRLLQFHLEGRKFVLDAGPPQVPKLAFLGVRPCDLAAMQTQDRVFGLTDPNTMRCESEVFYVETRRDAFVVVVNCTHPAGNCFCDSMGTGPTAGEGYDLALTELRSGFLIAAGSERGRQLAAKLPTRSPSSAELELADLKMHNAREHMGKKLDTSDLKAILDASIDHPQWDDVAKRCLSCGNCTLVCPTCFCSTVQDSTAPADTTVTRNRQWESCFTHQFTFTTAGPVRNTIRGRYRHWLRHKLCTWFEQFDSSGCVGCGRCITWCPVGIDLTAEAARIRATYQPPEPLGKEMPA